MVTLIIDGELEERLEALGARTEPVKLQFAREAITEAVRRIEEREDEAARWRRVEAEIESAFSGPTVELTDDVWEDLGASRSRRAGSREMRRARPSAPPGAGTHARAGSLCPQARPREAGSRQEAMWHGFGGRPAAADLAEVFEIAERGGMRLFVCDAHLESARLALATGDPAAARRHLAEARAPRRGHRLPPPRSGHLAVGQPAVGGEEDDLAAAVGHRLPQAAAELGIGDLLLV